MFLHYAKEYKIEYSTTAAFHCQQEAIENILNDHDCQMFDGDTDCLNVPREDIECMVDELKNTTAREEYGIPVDDLICFFEDAIKNAEPDDSDIHFSWF